MHSAITISLVPEARGGPFVFWDDLAAGCEKAAALGFDAVEVFPRSPQELNTQLLQSLLAQHRLKLAAVGTGAGWVVHKLRLTDPDAATRRRAREFVAAIIDLAGSFGAPAIIGSMQGRWEGSVSRDQALGWLAEALEELAPRAQTHGGPLLVEPLNRYETNLLNTVEDSLTFLKKLRAPNVKLLGDLFHMNIDEDNIADALRSAGPRLGHVHFADSNRRAVGFGHADIAPVVQALREINYNGYVSAEILPLPDSDTAARQTIASFRKWFPKS
jgi:sugar phosphate isomerase/epimerase